MVSEAAKVRALKRGPGFAGFLLAHHFPPSLGRCYQLWLGHRPIWICARCAGLLPVLLASLGLQLAWPVPAGFWDWPWLFALPVPAFVDWGRGRLCQVQGSNLARTLTGAVLGLSLGRTAFLHALEPFRPLVLAQLSLLALAVLGVEIGARWRAGRCA